MAENDDLWAVPEATPNLTGPGFLVRELLKRGIRCYAEYPKFEWRLQGNRITDEAPLWMDEWEDLAGTLVESIKEFSWFFEWGMLGQYTGHEWLECNACGQIQLRSKKDGAPSANRSCIMTMGCKGKMKRFADGIFEFVQPGKRKRKPSVSGTGSTKKGVPMEIRKEALAIFDHNQNRTDTARQMAAKYPEFKFSAPGISYWIKLRKENPEDYK